MKNVYRTALLLVVTVMIMGMFTGCPAEISTSAVSLVLGTHRYFPKINLSAETLYDTIYNAAYTYGDCSVVIVDGDPFVAANYSIKAPDAAIDNAKRKQIAKKNTEQIIAEASAAVAQTEEIDTLSAIDKSAAMLRLSKADEKQMLVYDSGLSTAALLNFAEENLIQVEPQQIVERLKELYALPDLTGIHVLWTGIGEVCGEQDELSPTYKHNLERIWEAIIVEGGGKVDFIDADLSVPADQEALPLCKTVSVIQDTMGLGTDIEGPIRIGEEVAFVGDEATYVNVEDARRALEPIATILKEHPNKKILMVGTTASVGGEESCKQLSRERADTCRQTLLEMGVSPTQIETLGLGRTECFLRVKDLDEQGNLIEEQAALNRAVFVIDCESEEAEQVKTIA